MIPVSLATQKASQSGASGTYAAFSPSGLFSVLGSLDRLHDQVLLSLDIHSEHRYTVFCPCFPLDCRGQSLACFSLERSFRDLWAAVSWAARRWMTCGLLLVVLRQTPSSAAFLTFKAFALASALEEQWHCTANLWCQLSAPSSCKGSVFIFRGRKMCSHL